MEAFLFLLDMALLAILLIIVRRAEQAGRSRIDSGIFAIKQDQPGKTDRDAEVSNA